MATSKKILIAFYGDDFTGSTDALEFLSRAGAKTILFIEPPTKEQLEKFPDLDAIGVAGKTRSMPPDEMESTLDKAFRALKEIGPRHIHYKVCSTFDSSPAIGSIGKAIDTGASIFNNAFVPVVVSAPSLGRYVVFGNLFARMGIGTNGKMYRLDRHPSMSKHPVTPADESDLRLHLAKQTGQPIGLIDILELETSSENILDAVHAQVTNGAKIVLFDALSDQHLSSIGAVIDAQVQFDQTLFSVGSSGIEMALGYHWQSNAMLNPVQQWPEPEQVQPLLVISGSCSPVTDAQIRWAIANGFEELVIDSKSICKSDPQPFIAAAIAQADHILKQNKSLIIHTGGTDQNGVALSSQKLGTALGMIAHASIKSNAIRRLVIAGGDTSSYAARALGIDAVSMIAPMTPGAPLCKAYSSDAVIDGLEVNFKGGQVGPDHYFGILQKGQ